jgi:hypothetical protein
MSYEQTFLEQIHQSLKNEVEVVSSEVSVVDDMPTLKVCFFVKVRRIPSLRPLMVVLKGDSHTGPVRSYQVRHVSTPDGVGFVERIENGFLKVRFADGGLGSYAQKECK